MTINTNQYCLVELPARDTVISGPGNLPQNYLDYYNINNSDAWSDPELIDIGWYPYVLIDGGAPGIEYNRILSEFTITATTVEQTATYEEWSQEQKDLNAPVSPIDWLEIPPEQRQFVNVPYESVDRFLVQRIFQTWNEPDDIYALSATLYTGEDADGMSVKIHNDDGTFLYTMTLEEVEPGKWYAETHSGSWGQHLERKAWRYFIFKGVDLTPEMRLPFEVERSTHDIKWNPPLLSATRLNGRA